MAEPLTAEQLLPDPHVLHRRLIWRWRFLVSLGQLVEREPGAYPQERWLAAVTPDRAQIAPSPVLGPALSVDGGMPARNEGQRRRPRVMARCMAQHVYPHTATTASSATYSPPLYPVENFRAAAENDTSG
jgi:hypothetical protein